MELLLLAIVLALLSLAANASASAGDAPHTTTQAPPITWEKGYTFGTAESHPHAGVQTTDGGFLVVGDGIDYANQTLVKRHLFVLKTSADGTLQWQRTFGDLGYNYGKFGIQLTDGRIVVAGALSSKGGQGKAILQRSLLVLDPTSGKELSRVLLPNTGADLELRDGFMSVVEGPSGELVATGFVGGENATTGYVDEPMFLIGGPLCSVSVAVFHFGSGPNKNELSSSFEGVLDDSDESFSARQGMRIFYKESEQAFAISHTVTLGDEGTFEFGLSLVRFAESNAGTQMKQIWMKSFPATPRQSSSEVLGGHASHPYALSDSHSKTGIAIGGLAVIYDSNGIEQCQGRLVEVDAASGKVVFDQRFTSNLPDTNIECYGLQATHDGGYILTCGTGVEPELHPKDSPQSKTWRVLVHRTDGEGKQIWQKTYTNSSSLQNNAGEYIVATRDGGYAVYVDSQSLGSHSTGGNFAIMMLGPDDSKTVQEYIQPSPVSSAPAIELFPGMVNLPQEPLLSWPPAPPYSHTVKDLGTTSNYKACEAKCISYRNDAVSPVSGWTKCESFTFTANDGRCVAVVAADEWAPRPASGAEKKNGTLCGRVTWPPSLCSSDADCSYNGICTPSHNTCSCRPAWTGDRCQTLALLPTGRRTGLRLTNGTGGNISTWGGGILQDEKGVYHMWASEMREGCGIDSWTTNSHIVHATCESETLAQCEFVRQEETQPAFSHEPNVVRAPSGEWVMYFTAAENRASTPIPCKGCSSGVTNPSCAGSAAGDGPTYMSWAKSPYGPWSTPERLFSSQENETNMDTNLAVVILNDGSVVGIGRTGGKPTGIVAHLVTASNWRDASSYAGEWTEMLFPDTKVLDNAGVEDPFVYLDAKGIIEADDEKLCGGHAYSVDGKHWTFTGTSWGNKVEWIGGGSYTFSRRERPHLAFDHSLNVIALTTGVQYGDGSPIAKRGQDACYTLLQPVKTA